MDTQRIILTAKKALEEAGITEYPIKIVQLCENAGIRVFQEYLPENVSGFIVVKDEDFGNYNYNKVISVNRSEPVTRRRFTIAHELGHYYLHRDKNDNLYAHRDAGQRGKIETEADIFASNLLMPEEMVRTALEYQNYYEGGSIPDTMKIITISKEFNVSREAATIRLKQLKLI